MIMHLVSLRGAITVASNTVESIDEATLLLMNTLVDENGISENDIVHVLFTATSDLTARYPSVILRQALGWDHTAMLNFEEKVIDGQLPRCIRVLLLIETQRPKDSFKHIYLREARKLRPDWVSS